MAAAGSSKLGYIPPAVAEMYDEATLASLEDYLSEDDSYPNPTDDTPADFSRVIVVDNLPVVSAERIPKLRNFLKRLYAQVGQFSEEGFVIPTGADGSNLGYAFLEFATAQQADTAVQSTNGVAMDATHNLIVNHFADIREFTAVPDEFVAPESKAYEVSEDLTSWMMDPQCRDQFVVRFDKETEVYWVEGKTAPVLDYGGEREKSLGKHWTELQVHWSPRGTYLATFHKLGVALWGGSTFKKLARFPQVDVSCIRFSPCERFIATWNGVERNDHANNALIIWDVRTGQMLRELPQLTASRTPDFFWSHDGAYLARLNPQKDAELIQVYETPSMGLLDKRSLKADGCQEIKWSPKANIIAWWSPERSNSPACVTLTELPSRNAIRTRNLFNVKACQLHWQDQGAFLCVQVTRTSKSGKTEFTDLELFRIQDKGIPTEMVRINERVFAFAWEPSGTRFAVVHGEAANKTSVSFYELGAAGAAVLIRTIVTPATNLFWAPQGNFLVIAAMGGDYTMARLEFYDASEGLSLATQEHYKCNTVVWDPSGRLVCSAVAQGFDGEANLRLSSDNGFSLWTFQGQKVVTEGKSRLFQFEWRPRPSVLTRDEQASVKANLKVYIKNKAASDRLRMVKARHAALLRTLQVRESFNALRRKRIAQYEAEAPLRLQLRNGMPENTPDVKYVDKVMEIMGEKIVEEL